MGEIYRYSCLLSILNHRKTWDIIAKPDDNCNIQFVFPNRISVSSRNHQDLIITQPGQPFEYQKTHADTFCVKTDHNEVYAIQITEHTKIQECEALMKTFFSNSKVSGNNTYDALDFHKKYSQPNSPAVRLRNNYVGGSKKYADNNPKESSNTYDCLNSVPPANKNVRSSNDVIPKSNSFTKSIDRNSSSNFDDNESMEERQQTEEEKLCEKLCDFIELDDKNQAIDIVNKLCKLKSKLTMYVLTNGRYSTEEDHKISITVKIESRNPDRVGTVIIDVNPYTTTIKMLKMRIAKQLGISVDCQRWIAKSRIAADHHYLDQYGIKSNNDYIYLYLASLKVKEDDDVDMPRDDDQQNDINRQRPYPENQRNQQQNNAQFINQQDYQRQEFINDPREQYFRNHHEFYPEERQNDYYRFQENLFYPPDTFGNSFCPNNFYPNNNHNYRQQRFPLNDEFQSLNINQGFRQRQYVPNHQRMRYRASFPNQLQDEFLQQQAAGFQRNLNRDRAPIVKKEEPRWDCLKCTTRNLPTMPSCDMCFGPRPAEYKVPDGYMLTPVEELRILEEKRNEELAKKWEEDEKRKEAEDARRNYRLLEQLNELKLIPNPEMFECPICFMMIEPGEGVMLRECLHCTCRDCLSGHINASEDPEPSCPMHEGFPCPAVITQQEIQELLTEEEYQKYLEKGLKQAESQAKAFHCRTVNCKGFCFMEDEVNEFPCPICRALNCITCRAIHPDMTCKQYQDELKIQAQNNEDYKKTQEMMERMIERGDAMHCPQCQIVLQKKSGCDWMRCTMCKTEICWATKGRRWGPKGNGDTSGGCKCGVNNKRCAPNCGNCH